MALNKKSYLIKARPAFMLKGVLLRLRSLGVIFINHLILTQAELPFGGTKRSGYGRRLSKSGIDEFLNYKLIRISELSNPF